MASAASLAASLCGWVAPSGFKGDRVTAQQQQVLDRSWIVLDVFDVEQSNFTKIYHLKSASGNGQLIKYALLQAAERRGECHMDDGYYCEKGKVLPMTENATNVKAITPIQN